MRLVALAAIAACHHHQPTVKQASLNDRVLALIAEYPEHGFGGYAWPAKPGTNGTTRDLVLAGETIARGGTGNHCVGITFEVFWRALDACAGGAAAVFAPPSATAFRARWFVPELRGRGAAEALPAYRLGVPVALDQARPGDFVQAWNREGTFGHSMVFLGWQRDATGKLAKIRFWSSQPWTDGIGESELPIGDDGVDLAQIYIARAACPAMK